MRISTKGRYGLAVMVGLAEKKDENQAVADIAKRFGFSKLYLEQVFSLLKNSGLIQSIKGSHGGYFLSSEPDKITVYDILKATEVALFEPTERTLKGAGEQIEHSLQCCVWNAIDNNINQLLGNITLQDVLDGTKNNDYMFYI